MVYDDLDLDDTPGVVRHFAARTVRALERADALDVARQRPAEDVWSALEYACHSRDVLMVQRERLLLALAEDEPDFASMRRDERAVEERYNEQDVAEVVAELVTNADAFAGELPGLSAAQWERVGVYHFPERSPRTIAWLARHTVHELVHHLDDVVRGVEKITGRLIDD